MTTKKAAAVWIFGFLAFVSVLHVFDAAISYLTGNTNSLLNLYPFYGAIQNAFGELSGARYFWASMISAFFLFGITCIIACQDTLNALIHKVLSEAETDNQMDQRLESSLSTLDMINHSLTYHSIDLNEVKITLQTLKDSINAMKTETARLSAKVGSLEKEMAREKKCPSCGKDILKEFKLCPYCGKELSLYLNIPTLKRP